MNYCVGPGHPATVIADAVRAGQVKALEVTEAAIERAVRAQGQLNCFAEIDAACARAAAIALDRRRDAGERLGALAGVPVAIKDRTPVAGLGNRFGSHAFANVIATKDALIVERFRAADA